MHSVHAALTLFHALAGAVALVSMWVPMAAKKGGRVHRRAGLVYVWAMAVVSVSAVVASALRIAMDPSKPQGPLFLSMVAVLSGAATWWGVSALRQKKRAGPSREVADWVAAIGVIVAGAAGIAYWAAGAMPLFVVFGALQVVLGGGFVRVLRAAPTSRWWWWFEHFLGMIVACIGTVTAFAVVNYGSAPAWLKAAVPSIAVWVAPGVVGAIALTWLKRHYRATLPP